MEEVTEITPTREEKLYREMEQFFKVAGTFVSRLDPAKAFDRYPPVVDIDEPAVHGTTEAGVPCTSISWDTEAEGRKFRISTRYSHLPALDDPATNLKRCQGLDPDLVLLGEIDETGKGLGLGVEVFQNWQRRTIEMKFFLGNGKTDKFDSRNGDESNRDYIEAKAEVLGPLKRKAGLA
jgi:hypothetical protein